MDTNRQPARRTLGVLLLALSFATAACSATSQAGSAAPTPVLQTVPEGQFTAEFPSAPIREEEPISTGGANVTLVTYTSQLPKETVAVGYIDYPKSLKLSLDRGAEASASGMNGTIQTKTNTTFMGHPAMDVVITTPEGPVYERLVLRGMRLYTLIGASEAGRSPAYDRLVETFVLL